LSKLNRRDFLKIGAASGAVAIRHLDPLLSAVVGARARAAAEQLARGRPLSG